MEAINVKFSIPSIAKQSKSKTVGTMIRAEITPSQITKIYIEGLKGKRGI